MGSIYNLAIFSSLLLILLIDPTVASGRRLTALVKEQPLILKYHNGAVLKGNITVNLIWYGKFTPTQRSIIVDFVQSLKTTKTTPPSASSWWKTTEKYKGGAATLVVGKQVLHEAYSLGKSLTNRHVAALAGKINGIGRTINVVLTASDVAVDGFCMSRCGTHGVKNMGRARWAYVWVGNS